MANRYRKNNNSSKNSSNHSTAPIIDKEKLYDEAFLTYTLKSDSEQNLLTEDFCYVISEVWWENYEDYLCFDEIVNDKNLKKTFGQKKPGKINENIISKKEKTLMMPEETGFLNIWIKESVLDKSEYNTVDFKLWSHVKEIYGGVEIKRPVQHEYIGDISCDELKESHVLFIDENMIEKIKTMTEEQFDKFKTSDFFFKIIQIPSKWTIQDLNNHFVALYKINYAPDDEDRQLNLWRLNNFADLDDFKSVTHNFSITSDVHNIFSFPGKILSPESLGKKTIEEFLKPSYYLIVEVKTEKFIFEEKVMSDEEKKDLVGYCETCNKNRKLPLTCICKEVFYCEDRCKYKDKKFHSNICELAYDSDSDDDETAPIETVDNIEGLNNVGNTCYMNAALQCLLSFDFIDSIYLKNKYLKILKKKQAGDGKKRLTKKFAKFTKKMHSNTISAPWGLKEIFSSYHPSFRGFSQHDSQEYLSLLLTSLHEEISLPLTKFDINFNDPWILSEGLLHQSWSDIVLETQGIFSSRLKCPSCDFRSIQYENFSVLPLPIANLEDEFFLDFNIVYQDLSLSCQAHTIKVKQNMERLMDLHQFISKFISSYIFAICEENYIVEILDDYTALADFKGRFKNKQLVVFENPPLTQDFLLISISVVSMIRNSGIGIALRNNVGVPRVIPIPYGSSCLEIYLNIFHFLSKLFPDVKDHFEEALEKEQKQKEEEKERLQKEEERKVNEVKLKLEAELKEKESPLKEEQKVQEEKVQKIEEPQTRLPPLLQAATSNPKKQSRPSKRKKHQDENKQSKTSQVSNQKEEEGEHIEKGTSEPIVAKFLSSLKFKLKTSRSNKVCIFCRKKICSGCDIPLEGVLLKESFIANSNILKLEILFDEAPDILTQGFAKEKSYGSGSKVATLDDCLELFSEEETLSKDNQWFCEKCNGMKQAEKKLEICFTSKYLILQLKRFKSLEKNKKYKNTQLVEYPVNAWNLTSRVKCVNPCLDKKLDFYKLEEDVLNNEENGKEEKLSEINESFLNSPDENHKKEILYDLEGIILHEGKMDEGHYIAYCRRKTGWKKYDDSVVSHLEERDLISKNAYILFYKLREQ